MLLLGPAFRAHPVVLTSLLYDLLALSFYLHFLPPCSGQGLPSLLLAYRDQDGFSAGVPASCSMFFCIGFSELPYKVLQTGGLDIREVSSHSSGGQTSEIQVGS